MATSSPRANPKYFYGPVFSRRLGFSLGVDLTPCRRCSFDCVYCQVGPTYRKTARSFNDVDLKQLVRQLKEKIKSAPRIDYITISGSGEPTLNSDLGKVMESIRKVAGRKYPICLITNSSLLYRKKVRERILGADVIIPSLSAPNAAIFKKINRPARGISFENTVSGLIKLRREFKGRIWLEIMLVRGLNDDASFFGLYNALLDKICPDEVHINLPVRPAPGAKRPLMPARGAVSALEHAIGKRCLLPRARPLKGRRRVRVSARDILASLARRPQTLKELAISLSSAAGDLKSLLAELSRRGKVIVIVKNKEKFFLNDGHSLPR